MKKTDLTNYWVIGDVHGCMFTLEKLVSKLPKESKLIFVGDLVDRGNYSKEVIEFVMQNNYRCVFGNHEYLMFNYARDAMIRGKQSMWSMSNETYGGLNTLHSYANDETALLKHIDFIEKLPKYLEIDDYIITHGFALPYYKRRDQHNFQNELYTSRLEDISLDWELDWRDYKVINVFGHTPYEEVKFGKNYIGVDTGAVFGNKLSAVNLLTKEVISQNSIEKDIQRK